MFRSVTSRIVVLAALERLGPSMARASSLIEGIGLASREQETGTEQIAQAVVDLEASPSVFRLGAGASGGRVPVAQALTET